MKNHATEKPLQPKAQVLDAQWATQPRWQGIHRPYSGADVIKLQGSMPIEYSFAQQGATKLWQLLQGDMSKAFGKNYINALGAITGGQAVQQVKAGLQAIYLSGWQVAADNNQASSTYPDQSLYPANSVPQVVKSINKAFQRADQIQWLQGIKPQDENFKNYFAPIIADAEAGFGGVLNAYELMLNMIEAGAAGVHFEDQLASAKKCGHMGGKVLVPTQEAIQKLISARLAADVAGVSTLIFARTDANAATLITSDIDERDQTFITGKRTAEGFYQVRAGIDQAIARGLAYAPYADLLWCETATPNLEEAKRFASAIHQEFPNKWLAYNCSPSFNWRQHLSTQDIREFQQQMSKLGYRFQFITLAGIHSMWYHMFDLAYQYARHDMPAYVDLQQTEFQAKDRGYSFVAHQQEVGTGYFDEIVQIIQGNQSCVTALAGSTEAEQF